RTGPRQKQPWSPQGLKFIGCDTRERSPLCKLFAKSVYSCIQIERTWSENEAENKVLELRQYFAPGGDWEQLCAIERAEAEAWESRWEAIA
ncbi:MAG: hypothetical protein SNJ57_09225, partial [Cyanobacteriota bacterium]